ncbi:hypothetical protein AB0E27_40215 [Streptomyces sparsogenes]|uniref:ParB/RepB/Spo0J family partition protein n=1 Tax=Streptomyces sparsogenes TaxID=67365 RepID=UPI0034025A75
MKDFGLILKKRQLQPAVVVSRAGYLKLWPEEEANVGDASYAIANGERRYRGSLAAELQTLNVVHNEDVAASRADFLDAVLSENNDREDLDPIERAIGIETMVIELGGADPVAEHYGKTKGWVSRQRKLLTLTAELQELVSSGDMPVRVGREIAGLPHEEQATVWAEEVRRRDAAKALPRTRAPKRSVPTSLPPQRVPAPAKEFAGQQTTPADAPGSRTQPESAGHRRFTAVNQRQGESTNAEAAGKSLHPETVAVEAMPWGDPVAVARIASERMSEEILCTLGKLLRGDSL